MSTSVTTPNELEIRVERIFDAPRTHVYSVWTDPRLIPEWWGDGTVVEEMDVRPGGTYRFRTVSDDGTRLWLSGVQRINNWSNHSSTTDSTGSITFTVPERKPARRPAATPPARGWRLSTPRSTRVSLACIR